jgi:aminoglycoside phosphotransferase (APT) family kinase protein
MDLISLSELLSINFKDTERGRAAVQAKMEQETATIRIVKATVPGVPVPEIFYTDPRPSNVLGAPYMLMEKLAGKTHGYNGLKGADMVMPFDRLGLSLLEPHQPFCGP